MAQITILLPSLRGGGMEKKLLLLADELIKRNFDVDVVVVNTINTAYTPNPKINLFDLQVKHIRYALLPFIKYLKKAKPQVVLSAETPLNAIAIIARKITGYPKQLIVSERNHVSSVAKHSKQLGDIVRPLIVKYLYPHSNSVITVSKGVAEDLIKSCGLTSNKIQTLYNMFDINSIIIKSKLEAEHLPKDKYPIILNIGRLSTQKDQATLIKAFAILRKKTPCHLLILGEGEERAKLVQLAQHLKIDNDVLMPGFVANPYAYIARANLFVLSSAWEGLPGVLIEALACGTSIISTDCPSGPSEILEDGKYGMLTPIGDVTALANTMEKILIQPFSPDLLHQRAMDFSIEKIMPQYLELLMPASNTIRNML